MLHKVGCLGCVPENDFSNIIYTGNVLCYDNSRIGFARLISFLFLSILNYFMG